MSAHLIKLRILVLLIAAVWLSACSTIPFDPAKTIYTADGEGYSTDEIGTLLDKLMRDDMPIILFIHGRGNEPKKSLRGGFFVSGRAVPKLEEGYGAHVLMFNWDSKRGRGFRDRERPLLNMPAAADSLRRVLAEIARYRSRHPTGKPIVLLAHSMGNIVLQTLVAIDGGWPTETGDQLFSNVLLSASDADDIGHASWVEQIAGKENVYVTINRDDHVLLKSTEMRDQEAIAMGLEPGPNPASSAIYVDISGLGPSKKKPTERHELFNKNGMHSQVHVCRFFDQALNGQSVVLSGANSIEVVRNQRYKLKFERNRSDECFS